MMRWLILACLLFLAAPVGATQFPVADWTHGRVIAAGCVGSTLVTGAGDVDDIAMQCEEGGAYVVTARVPSNASGLNFIPTIDVATASTSGTGCFEFCTAVAEEGTAAGALNFGNCQVIEVTPDATTLERVRDAGAGAALYDGAAGDCDSNCASDVVYVQVTVGTVGGCTHNDTNPWLIFGSIYSFGE